MDVALEGAFHSLAEDQAVVEMNERLDMLFMAMESYKIFSVLLGDAEDEEDNLFDAMESYVDDNFEEAMEAKKIPVPEADQKMLDDIKPRLQEIAKVLYNRDKNMSKSKLLDRVTDLFTTDPSLKAVFTNNFIKKEAENKLYEYYNEEKNEKQGGKSNKYADRVLNTNGSGKDYKEDEKPATVEGKAKRSFGQIVKEFFKSIIDGFKKLFGDDKGKLQDSNVIVYQGLDPDNLHSEALTILQNILNTTDESKIQKYTQDLQNLVNDVKDIVKRESLEAKKSDKYVGVARLIHPSTWGKKVDEVSRKQYKLKDTHMKSLKIYQDLINQLCKSIYKKKTAEDIHSQIGGYKKRIEKNLKQTNKDYDRLKKEADKLRKKGKTTDSEKESEG